LIVNLNRRLHIAFVIGILLLIRIDLFSQIYNYTHYKVENGFPQSNVDCIYQDHEGFMWFATQIGIVKFDGFKYDVINKESGLNYNVTTHITQDQTQAFWISTKVGVTRIKQNNYKSFTINEGLYSDLVYCTFPLEDGTVLICTGSGTNLISENRVIKIDSSKIIIQFLRRKSGELLAISKTDIYLFKNNRFEDLIPGTIEIKGTLYSMVEDQDSTLWLASSEGIYKFAGENSVHYTEKDGLLSNFINCLLVDSENSLWYSSEQKGCGKLQNGQFLNFTVEKGMVNTAVLSLFEDHEKNIWIGGRNGVIMFNPKIPFIHFNQISPIEDEIIMGMTMDRHKNIWFCSYGLGIFKYDGKEFINYNKNNGSIDDHFFDVEEDQYGNLWFASVSNGIIKYDGKRFIKLTNPNGIQINKRILTIFKDSKNNLWFGTNGNGLITYDGKKFKLFGDEFGVNLKNVMSVNEDNDHNIWIGTVDEGLFRYNGSGVINFDKTYGIKTGIIRSIVNEKGMMWFGTATNGVFRLIKENTIYKQYYLNKENGLQSNNIYLMHYDSKGNLWVGSEKGVDKIKIENHYPVEIVNFTKDDGFTGVETNLNGSLEDDQGNMWFGTINGALMYNEKSDHKNMVENKIYITDITLFHESFDQSEYSDSFDYKGMPMNLRLPYNKNHLTFHFIGLCYSHPSKVKYSYRLIGHNNDWSPPSNDKKAVFSNIEPGVYEFQVISANDDGLWNKAPAVFKFEIITPIWQRIPFKVSVIFAVLLIIYIVVEIRNKSLKIAKLNLEKKVAERTFELNEQKNKLETSNNKITEGINYARKIQTAMLPTNELFDIYFSDYFILYLPKDIVSGDFYWTRDFTHETGHHIVVAVADCTGHGIPGALVSMLGMALLNEIIRKKEITTASQVLEELRNDIKRSLKQKGALDDQTEGIDMVLCDINTTSGEMQFAGANNPLYLIRGKELTVIKPTINPVGIFLKEMPFENHTIKLQSDDTLIMFSDGIIDQFNEKGEKYKVKRFRDLILSSNDLKLADQKKLLEDAFLNWKGDVSQIDDVLVIALKIK
jgi:ligand-binding sensor domain-containing protein/serine phosphatase RsbU (regulator of sigma subunit)